MNSTLPHHRVSLNLASAYSWSLDRFLPFCNDIGIEAIVCSQPRLSELHDGIEQVKNAGLRCVSVAGGIHPLIESGEKTLEQLQPLVDTASDVGSGQCYCLTGTSPSRISSDEAFDRLAGTLGPITDYARNKGIRFGIEHNSISTRQNGFINTLADAIDLSRATDIGICLEIQNCWYERNLERMLNENIDKIMLVQFNDFVLGEPLQYNRAVPGDGDIPLEWIIARLLEAGYSGYFDLEILGPRIEKEGYESSILRGIEWLTERLIGWGVK